MRCVGSEDLSLNTPREAVFSQASSYSALLWFSFTGFCDWLARLPPLSQPIRSQTKTNRDLRARVFPRLAPFTCIYFEF